MRSQYEYLAVLGVCLLITMPLEWMGRGVYRRAPDVVRAVAPVLVVLVVWDVVAILRGHWSFHPEATTGVAIGGVLPIEEVLFFVAIPLCALLTYEAVRGPSERWLPNG
ncbi:lycopene cyclase domain-containing protein [Lentzea atacamensis]|uniref:Lycopene cyclase domain-containing protein n=2 Tax=Lentzea TaxID=165301 RepID=A0A316I466_9PSEU|nr:lycopene cyclase domain-containing protein [Lentzea atacamensis]PWK88186.1 lycopene cyclase domain-containing protein [Lentzea atacamensis]RAS71083.1 lycopene cyclase domain-containing protein [Lentzea atacamensis]